MIPVDVLARAPLLPLLLGQALAVRRKAQVLPEPTGARSGVSGGGPPLRLLIVGDSSAAGVGVSSQPQALSGQLVNALSPHFQVSWQLEAKTGATTRSTLTALSGLEPARFDVAILALGVNDVTRMTTQTQWLTRQKALFDLLRGRFGVGRIIASGVPPMGAFPLLPEPLRWVLGCQAARFDTALAGLAAQSRDLRHIPFDFPPHPDIFASDGFHPSARSYTSWANVLAGQITPP